MPLRRVALLVMLPLAACAAGVEDEAAPSDAADDGAETVVPAHAIAGDDGAPDRGPRTVQATLDERANLRAIALWDFEAASADCSGWQAVGAKAIRAIPSHTGSYACKLCADGSTSEMSLKRRVAGLPRGRWVVSAWMRRLDASAEIAARVTLDEATERAYPPSKVMLVEEWRLLGDPLEVTNDVASATLNIAASAAAGECILVDDVLVESATAKSAQASAGSPLPISTVAP